MKNDLSFIIDSRLSLFEHQSTYNPNMPLRGFLYFSDFQDILSKSAKSEKQISLLLSLMDNPDNYASSYLIRKKLAKTVPESYRKYSFLYNQKADTKVSALKSKSARRGSNPRPPPWQGGAPPLSHSRMFFSTVFIFMLSLFQEKSARRDSNSRPSPWQGDALPLSHSRTRCSRGDLNPYPETRTRSLV